MSVTATQKIEAVPPVGEIRRGVHGVQFDRRLRDEDDGIEYPEALERVRQRVRRFVPLARHRHRVHDDDEHDAPLEFPAPITGVADASVRILRVVIRAGGLRRALQALLGLHPHLLRLGHRRRGAVSGLAAELREVVQDDTHEEVEDEEVGHHLKRDKEKRDGRIMVTLGSQLGRSRVHAVVHHSRPALRGAHLEERLHGVEDVVEVHVVALPFSLDVRRLVEISARV